MSSNPTSSKKKKESDSSSKKKKRNAHERTAVDSGLSTISEDILSGDRDSEDVPDESEQDSLGGAFTSSKK